MNDVDPKTWPSLDLAYEFVMPSYHMLATRFEAADSRIASLMAMTSSFQLASPVLAQAVRRDIWFASGWFVGSLVVFCVITILGLIARMNGALVLPNPAIIRETAIAKVEWRFKADALYLAGQHFEKNAEAINRKGNWSIWLTCLIVLQVVLLVVWIAR